MNEKRTNIGDILGKTMGGMMGATAPMMTGMIRSMLSPGMIKSVTRMIPDLLGAVVEAISSIDLGEILSSTLGAILPIGMKLLDPLLGILGPIIEALLDMLTPVLEIVGPLLEVLGPLLDPVIRPILKLMDPLLKPFLEMDGASLEHFSKAVGSLTRPLREKSPTFIKRVASLPSLEVVGEAFYKYRFDWKPESSGMET
ncbi:MAG: hypothetical protein EF807_04035 [Candidatus Methanolliviera hydrocarbonicum]|uniref:Uncharacterized protein n=1 Tax=Candidatus Methanolliviera hydrocarbonicum TaxID=2491085 RepID=A0A520KWW5_9EURY|nr:MAG: hypothetical protein EF807_04035 [Candidatus Methanolliviera hydrocarbonicum]